MNVRQEVLSSMEVLDEFELGELARFAQFLKFRRRIRPLAANLTDDQLAALYDEVAEEDQALAEAGLADSQAALAREDSA